MELVLVLLCISQLVTLVNCSDYQEQFDNYINRPTPEFKWHQTGHSFWTLSGNRAYVLNVTSFQWLDESVYRVVGGSTLWTHEVVVVVPRDLKYTNVSTLYLASAASRCNTDGPITHTNMDIEIADLMANDVKSIVVVSFQTPNCKMVFKDDPDQKQRYENSLVAWTLREFHERPDHKPERIILYPMAKATLMQIKAAQEFIRSEKFADLEDGWFVLGVSKRGWTSYLVGGANQTIANILGIIPLNPVIPNMVKELHHQYKSYGGLSFAFKDIVTSGLLPFIFDDNMQRASNFIDPLYLGDKLRNVPKMIVTASGDELMMMEWSQYWYDQFNGETHLMITPNAEHTLFTNIPGALSAATTFIKSIQSGRTSEQRPKFDYTYNNDTGELSVIIPEQFLDRVQSVYSRHTETMSEMRRDFRWVRVDNNYTEPCQFPWFKLPFGLNAGGADCMQLILWNQLKLKEVEGSPGKYSTMPPKPSNSKHWVGYYIEVYFDADTDMDSWLLHNHFAYTTPGYVWPNTFPYDDCSDDCKSVLF